MNREELARTTTIVILMIIISLTYTVGAMMGSLSPAVPPHFTDISQFILTEENYPEVRDMCTDVVIANYIANYMAKITRGIIQNEQEKNSQSQEGLEDGRLPTDGGGVIDLITDLLHFQESRKKPGDIDTQRIPIVALNHFDEEFHVKTK